MSLSAPRTTVADGGIRAATAWPEATLRRQHTRSGTNTTPPPRLTTSRNVTRQQRGTQKRNKKPRVSGPSALLVTCQLALLFTITASLGLSSVNNYIRMPPKAGGGGTSKVVKIPDKLTDAEKKKARRGRARESGRALWWAAACACLARPSHLFGADQAGE